MTDETPVAPALPPWKEKTPTHTGLRYFATEPGARGKMRDGVEYTTRDGKTLERVAPKGLSKKERNRLKREARKA